MIIRKSFGKPRAEPAAALVRAGCILFAILPLLCFLPPLASAQEFRVRILAPYRGRQVAGGANRQAPARPAVVTVSLDAYVEGVLAGEASILRRRAALQAMAVLIRTWALRNRGRHAPQGFDFCSLTHCQVFRLPSGYDRRYRSDLADAAMSTRGLVLMYQGQLADPYFTADCGGFAESAANVWPDRNLPYLLSAPDPYCVASRHFSWRRQITLAQAMVILRDEMHLPVWGAVRGLAVASRDSSGRAHTLQVLAGTSILVDANQFRYAVGRRLGWDVLKSNLYSVKRSGNSLIFNGHGLGHGVGLCQAGAAAMADLGMPYQQILAHYFPGTTVGHFSPAAKTQADPSAASDHFELLFPEQQQPWVGRALMQLEEWRGILAKDAPLGGERVRVETWNSTVEFIRATGEPGWVAGSDDGRTIYLQPLSTLAAKGILNSTLRHELTHIALHRLRAPGVPRWFEEGLVLFLTGEQFSASSRQSFPRRTLAEALARPRSAAEMRAAYARAALLVQRLAAQEGSKKLWQVLEHPTPADLNWLKTDGASPVAFGREIS